MNNERIVCEGGRSLKVEVGGAQKWRWEELKNGGGKSLKVEVGGA